MDRRPLPSDTGEHCGAGDDDRCDRRTRKHRDRSAGEAATQLGDRRQVRRGCGGVQRPSPGPAAWTQRPRESTDCCARTRCSAWCSRRRRPSPTSPTRPYGGAGPSTCPPHNSVRWARVRRTPTDAPAAVSTGWAATPDRRPDQAGRGRGGRAPCSAPLADDEPQRRRGGLGGSTPRSCCPPSARASDARSRHALLRRCGELGYVGGRRMILDVAITLASERDRGCHRDRRQAAGQPGGPGSPLADG